MACLPNLNTILNLDFSGADDSLNWTTDSIFPVAQVGGKLVLNPSSSSTTFTRILGIPDPTNNRIQVKLNFELQAMMAGPSAVEVEVDLIVNNEVIESSCAEFAGVANQNYQYFLDRTYSFVVMPTTAVSLRITIPQGWEYQIGLEDLDVTDFNYCADNVRAYFILDNFFEPALTALSGGIRLDSWEVDGVETLTADFFSENLMQGSNPLATWFFARADLDGSDRVSDDVTPNSFNPFYEEWGMDFANVAGNFRGGKTLGSISGSDYGTGILSLGIDRPKILDGTLSPKHYVFFLDLNLEVDLQIKFEVLLSLASANPYTDPFYRRSYTIRFNSLNCQTEFFYVDELTGETVLAPNFGWLSGVTGQDIQQIIVPCDENYSVDDFTGNTQFTLELDGTTGEFGINYNSYGIPKRFIVSYDGTDYDTGYVGLDSYDADLLANGVSPGDINTTPSGNGAGTLLIPKPSATPLTAKVVVESPLGTGWLVEGICPRPIVANLPPTVTLTAQFPSISEGGIAAFSVLASDPDGVIDNWTIDWGDGSPVEAFSGPPPTSITHKYTSNGSYTALITVFDNGTPVLSDSDTAGITVSAPAFEVINAADNNCQSCLSFRVVVPTGSTYTLLVTSAFASPATWAATFCDDGGTVISADSAGTPLTAGTYEFNTGIDAAKTSDVTLNSSIIIQIKDGTTTLEIFTLQRVHSASIC